MSFQLKKITRSVMGLAVLAGSLIPGVSNADLLQYEYMSANGQKVTASKSQNYVNAVGDIEFTLSAGLERIVLVRIEDDNGQVVSETQSNVLTANDRIEVKGQQTYGASLKLPAPSEGSYTVFAETLGRWGNVIQIDSYPLTIDLTSPKITGSIKTEGQSGYAHIGEQSGYPDINVFGTNMVGAIYVTGISDSSEIKEVWFRAFYAEGEKKGQLASEQKASYSNSAGEARIKPSYDFFPDDWTEYKLEFEVIDKAGNKATISHVAGYGGCGIKPEPVAMYKPGHTGSYAGQQGYISWSQGDTIYSNPYKVIWRLPKSSLYPASKYGYRNFTMQFSDNTYAYQIVEKAVTDTPSGNNGNFTTTNEYNCAAHDNILGPLANDVAPSPKRTYLDLKVEGKPWGTYYQSLPSKDLDWKPTKPERAEQLRVFVESRNYAQKITVDAPTGAKTCNVAINSDSCVVDIDWTPPAPSIYSPWKITVSDPSRNLNAHSGYVKAMSSYENMEIKDLRFNTQSRSAVIEVLEPMSTTQNATMYWYPIRGEITLKQNGASIYEASGSQIRYTTTLYGYTFDLNDVPTGFYDVSFETESYQNKIYNKDFSQQILIDHNPPTIDVNIDDGTTIETLDDIKFTVTDAENAGVFVDYVNLTGGPTEENVNLGSRTSGNTVSLEYPVIFPSLIEGEQYTVELGAIDTQGNTASKAVTFVYQPPEVGIYNGMDGQIWVPAIAYEFQRLGGGEILQSEVVTLSDGSPISGTYDVIASLRSDAVAPLIVNGETVYPGTTFVVAGNYDFSANKSRINLPLKAAIEGEVGLAKLLVTTSAPNSPVILVDVSLWNGEINLQSNTWRYHQIVDPLNIMAMPAPGVPCRVTTDEKAAAKADVIRDPVCYLEWTKIPDEAELSNEVMDGLRVAGLVGTAMKLGKQEIAYDLYLYSGDGIAIQIGGGEQEIEVVSALDTVAFKPDLKDMMALRQVEEISFGFKQTKGDRCNLTTDAGIALSNSKAFRVGSSSNRTCLFEWIDLPNSLNQDKYSSTAGAQGRFAEVGDYDLAWRISMFSAKGTRVTLQEGSDTIHVIEPESAKISFSAGSKVDEFNDVYLAQADARSFGSVNIEAVNSDLDITIKRNGQLIMSETVPKSTYQSHQSLTRELPLPEDPIIWSQSDFEVEVAYTDLPEFVATYNLTGYVAPKDSVKPAIVSDINTAIDTELLPLSVQIQDSIQFRDPYDESTMGVWEVRVIKQDARNGDAPASEWQTIDDQGQALFNLSLDDSDSRTIRFYAQAKLVSPIEGYERLAQSPRPVIFAVLLGGAIDADVVTRRLSGEAPYKITFKAMLQERDMYNSTGDITWQISNDGGSTWDSYTPPDRYKFQYSTTLNKGTYLVRAVTENKYSGIEAITEQAEIIVYEKPELLLEGADILFIGASETITAKPVIRVFNEETNEIETLDYEVDETAITWSLDGGKNFTESGNEITLTSDEPLRYALQAKIRSKEAPADDKYAYNVTKKSVEFKAIRPPRVRVIGPSLVETGETYQFSVNKDLPYSKMKGEINGFFTMPDGSIVYGDSTEYTPTSEELMYGYLNTTYTAWVEGYREAGSEGSHTLRSRVWQYTWPNFTVDVRADADVAPANISLRVRTTNYNGKLERPKYEWNLPEGIKVLDASNAVARDIVVQEPGNYAVSVKVSDARGHESILNVPLDIGEPDPYVVDLTYASSPAVLRDPVEVTLRSKISGGHPRDRIDDIEWVADGQPIEGTKTFGRTVLDAGKHTLGINFTSRLGEVVNKTIELDVAENKVPVCKLTGRENINSLLLRADCEDEDGRVKMFEWSIDGETRVNSSRSLSITKKRDEPAPSISVIAIDDSGGKSLPVTYTSTQED